LCRPRRAVAWRHQSARSPHITVRRHARVAFLRAVVIVCGALLAADSLARAVNALADEYVRGYFAYRPEDALVGGATGGDQGAIVDNSLAALGRWHATEDAMLRRARAIDPKTLVGRPEWVTYGMLRETLEDAVRLRVCR
jgi:uncharacterized protein (DUF885 family)